MSWFEKQKEELLVQRFKYNDRVINNFGRIGTIVDASRYRLIPPDQITWHYRIKWDDGEFDTHSDYGDIRLI